MTYLIIRVGTGGHGTAWCHQYLPPNVADGLSEVVAAVDVDAHENATDDLGLDSENCYPNVEAAFAEHPEADFCSVVVPPPWIHEEIVDAALEYDLHVLSEKPIADTLEASVRIANKVQQAWKKMGMTMSHRFNRDKTTFREELRRDRNGQLDYLISRSRVTHARCFDGSTSA